MKKIMTLALAAMMTMAASAQPTRTQQFSTVKVNAPVRLTIVPGRSYSVNVMSSNAELTSALSWTVENGELRLNAIDRQSLDNSDDEVRVVVTAPEGVSYEIGNGMEEVSSWERSVPVRHRFPGFRHMPARR